MKALLLFGFTFHSAPFGIRFAYTKMWFL